MAFHHSRIAAATRPPGSTRADAPPVPRPRDVTREPGQPLDPTILHSLQWSFGRDLNGVRVHTGERAAASAKALGARAYTIGGHIVFGPGEYAPTAPEGARLLAHELAHTVQQGEGDGRETAPPAGRSDPAEAEAGRAAAAVSRGEKAPALSPAPARVARQAEPDAEPPKDPWAGTTVVGIDVSLARKRVAFLTKLGAILGDVETDLKVGTYKLRPVPKEQKWEILEPAVPSGSRFTVNLEGANPWTLAYQDPLTLRVAPGALKEPETWPEMVDENNDLIDPIWPLEGMPGEAKPKPVEGIDDFESVSYNVDYRSEGGNLSKWLVVDYRDDTRKDINLDTITEATPRLWAAKQKAIEMMEGYNFLFIVTAFPAVWTVITIAPTAAPIAPIPAPAGPRTIAVGGGGPGGGRGSRPPPGGGAGKGSPPAGEPGKPIPAAGQPAAGARGPVPAAVARSGPGATKTPAREPPPAAGAGAKKPSGGAGAPAKEPPPAAVAAGKPDPAKVARALAKKLADAGEPVIANIGGAGAKHEPPNAININNQAVPRQNIPSHVDADGSDIGKLFEPATVDRVEGHNMAPGVIDWTRAAPGCFKVLKPGGKFSYYYRGANDDAKVARQQLIKAGFKDVQVTEDVLITATKP
jgi:hypothetical protein